MRNPLLRLVDAWLRRRWSPDPEALARIEDGQPATVITGASEGIGRALAHAFAAAGHTVALVARSSDRLAEAANEIARDYEVGTLSLPLDVTTPDACDRIASAVRDRGLYVDVLVNNAGIGLSGNVIDQKPEDLTKLLATNLMAPTLLMRQFLPDMCVRGRGGILNVASLGGYVPGPYEAAYYASKAYMLSLTKAVAWEVRGRGVRIAVLAPGPVDTAFHAKMRSEDSLYRWLLPSSSAESTARSAVRGFLWGRSVITPGPVTSSLALALRIMPTTIALPLMSWLLAPREKRDVRR